MNILWVVNKYLEGGSLSRYYPYFLKAVEDEVAAQGHKIYFIFFSDAMKKNVKTKNNFFYDLGTTKPKNIDALARSLEIEYCFTFKEANFSEIIQTSKLQDTRKINLPEKELNQNEYLVPRFLFLKKIIDQKKIDVVLSDQSAEAEMEFARSICRKEGKISLRYLECFLGRSLFIQQFAFGKERVVLTVLDKSITYRFVKEFVDDFVKNNRLPYKYPEALKADFKEFYLPRILKFYKFPQYLKRTLMTPYLFFEEKIIKPLVRHKFDKSKDYFFFGFHLPTESTIALRGLPYMNQTSLIESMSRLLPSGYLLYVREHPTWRTYFPWTMSLFLRKIPSVRIITTDIPVAELIKHSRGVLTYNATTGIEALMHGKPVLSFAPNVYSGFHPAAELCLDLFTLSERLVKLPNTKVEKEDTYRYIYSLMRSSSGITLTAGTFLTEADSAKKGPRFARDLLLAAAWCGKNKQAKPKP